MCHPQYLRETADILKFPLSTIFNKTFEEGEIPASWKQAIVSALYKSKGDKTDCANYRPISLTSVPCKLCEKSVREIIMKHREDNKLFSDSQFGFRNARSCTLQLLDVLDDLMKTYHETMGNRYILSI